jgi:pimeloyl-[acyl-carrier protein] synthase
MIAEPSLLEEVDALYACRQDAIDDPYPIYHRMRTSSPVLIHNGVAAITRYADVETILRNMDDYSNSRGRGSRITAATSRLGPDRAAKMQEALDFMDMWVVQLDPPAHTRVRGLAHRALTPRRVLELKATVERITDELLDQAAEKGEVDFIDDFAYQLPLFVIGAMLGMPTEDRDRIRYWSDTITKFIGTEFSNVEETQKAIADFRVYLHDMIVERRKTRHTDLLAALLEPDEAGDKLSREELEGMFMVLLFAGHETTTNLIGNSLYTLLRKPDHMRQLREDPSLIPMAIEEFLRFESPAQVVHRVARNTTTVSETEIPAGTTIRLLMGAANRDPERIEDPDRLDFRRDVRHLAFGIGPHFCLGQALTRLEGPIALEHVLQRFPSIELSGEARWRRNITLRGLEVFPISVN